MGTAQHQDSPHILWAPHICILKCIRMHMGTPRKAVTCKDTPVVCKRMRTILPASGGIINIRHNRTNTSTIRAEASPTMLAGWGCQCGSQWKEACLHLHMAEAAWAEDISSTHSSRSMVTSSTRSSHNM